MALEKYINGNNWPTDLDEAKEFAREAVAEWKYRDKVQAAHRKIDEARSVPRLQHFIINAILSGDGLKVL